MAFYATSVSSSGGEGHDEGSIDKMSELFGPGHFDQTVRSAIQTCRMSLPKERRSVDKVEHEIRRITERARRYRSLAMMLKVMGNDTRTAYDGEEAVAAASTFGPNVILLDIGLPKLNGYEACRRIRGLSEGKEIVVIAQTGWGQDEDRQRTHEAGFDHHLVKPVNPRALMKLLVQLSNAATR